LSRFYVGFLLMTQATIVNRGFYYLCQNFLGKESTVCKLHQGLILPTLRAAFLYKAFFAAFFYLRFCFEFLAPIFLYKKRARKMLMKLTTRVNSTNITSSFLPIFFMQNKNTNCKTLITYFNTQYCDSKTFSDLYWPRWALNKSQCKLYYIFKQLSLVSIS